MCRTEGWYLNHEGRERHVKSQLQRHLKARCWREPAGGFLQGGTEVVLAGSGWEGEAPAEPWDSMA